MVSMGKINAKKYKSKIKQGVKPKFMPEINRSKLAKDIGITRAHMSRIFSGKVYPGMKILSKLAKALGCSLDAMVKVLDKVNK
jgi:transcriptional regulator with XRE-family HTH domain